MVRRSRRVLVALIMWGALGVGCGEDPQDLGPPAVEIGEGDVEFVSLVAAQDVFVIQGPQGGFHLLGSVRVRGLEPGDPDDLASPDNPTTDFRVLRGGIRIDKTEATSYVQGLKPSPGGGYEMVGRLIILDILSDDEVDGNEMVFEVEVTDRRGMSASDRRTIRTVPHPANL